MKKVFIDRLYMTAFIYSKSFWNLKKKLAINNIDFDHWDEMLAFCILKAYNLIFLLMDFSRFVLIDHFLGESSKSTLSENTEETLAFMI